MRHATSPAEAEAEGGPSWSTRGGDADARPTHLQLMDACQAARTCDGDTSAPTQLQGLKGV